MIFDNGVNPENNRPYNCKVMFTGARLIDQTSRRDEPEELKREPQEAMERIIRNDSRTAIVHKFSHEAKVLRNSAITKETGIAVGVGAKISSENRRPSYGVISAEQKLGLELSASLDVSHMQNGWRRKAAAPQAPFKPKSTCAARRGLSRSDTTHDAEFERRFTARATSSPSKIDPGDHGEADRGQEVCPISPADIPPKGVFHAQILAAARRHPPAAATYLWERRKLRRASSARRCSEVMLAAEARRITRTQGWIQRGGRTQTLTNLEAVSRGLMKGGGNPS